MSTIEQDRTIEPPPARPSPPEGLVIRARRVADCEQLAAMTQQPRFLRNTLRVPFQSVEETRRWIENARPGDTGIVAEVGDRVIGSADLHRFAGRRAHVASLGIGVHDDWQGRGIGSAMLGALVRAADDWLGVHRIELTVFSDNAPAIALYRKFGFTEEGLHRAYAFREGIYADCLAMARVRG